MQLVRLFRDGEIVRMSKRSGQYITLSELIDEVGKDAARYFFVMRSPDSHLDFDMDLAKAESSDNPVYYVQYAHARISSILKACTDKFGNLNEVDFTLLKEEAELELIRKIADLPEEIIGAAENFEPHRITRYAHDLASLFHSFYNSCRVLTDEEELRKARLVLVDAARITLRNVLILLGVSAPERM
jgi:arginyl-tRNA synthetase